MQNKYKNQRESKANPDIMSREVDHLIEDDAVD